MSITCESILLSAYNTLTAALSAVGVGGGGVYFIKVLKHMPAPKLENRWRGAIFDSIQDTVSNTERVGERLAADGTLVKAPQLITSQATPAQEQQQQ